MVESLVIIGILAVVALLTQIYGVDTRDGDDWFTHRAS
jgi:hypothetical protein